MNLWYISSLIIIGLAIVILVGCIFGSIFGIKKILNVLNERVQRIQQQVQPIQTQVNILSGTVNRLTLDISLKQSEIVEVTESCKKLVKNINELSVSSRLSTKQLVDKVNNDPQRQAQTEQWTNIAMGYLKKNA